LDVPATVTPDVAERHGAKLKALNATENPQGSEITRSPPPIKKSDVLPLI
jgi:hypothetical protein